MYTSLVSPFRDWIREEGQVSSLPLFFSPSLCYTNLNIRNDMIIFLKKYEGVAIIRLYDEKGELIKEFAKPEFKDLFLWPLFAVMMLIGLAIIGHVA